MSIKSNLMMGAALAALTVGSAMAADLPTQTYSKAPVLEAPPGWTGFYVGGNVGGGWNTNSWTNDILDLGGNLLVNVPALGNGNASGILGGFQGGFNYQIAPKLVIGIEGEYDFSDIHGNSPFSNFSGGAFGLTGLANTRERNIAAVTGRIGGVYHDDILIYVKGGWAWSQFRYDVSVGEGVGGVGIYPTQTDNRDGYTLGLGTEYKLDRNWSAKIEYDFYNFGTKTLSFPQGSGINLPPPPPFRVDISQQTHVIKAGFNYNFGWMR